MLDEKQERHFLEKGYVVIGDCFPERKAREIVLAACRRAGCDLGDPKTWKEERAHTPGETSLIVRDFAPKAWAAICDLVGGEERIENAKIYGWLDSFIVKFPRGTKKGWVKPSADHEGWHKDGGPEVKHTLTSPRIGLLNFALWSEVKPAGGGTFLACDSIGRVAKCLAEHPEGIFTGQPPFLDLVYGCKDFVELTGRPGDVALVHPFMLHAESSNTFGAPRFQTIGMVTLKEPLDLKRRRAADYSLVEKAILMGLDQGRERAKTSSSRP